jgi:Uma2 family endonuclease
MTDKVLSEPVLTLSATDKVLSGTDECLSETDELKKIRTRLGPPSRGRAPVAGRRQRACVKIAGRREIMTSIPLTEERVGEDFLILNVEKVGLSDEQFMELCSDNRELSFELTAQKELVIMTLPGAKTIRRNTTLSTDLEIWARQDATGIAFNQGGLFHLPNGAKRGPDASWVRNERWNALTDEQQEKIPPFCPDFVAVLMSPSDKRQVRFRMLQAKMTEYVVNGAQLGWLIDPFNKKVYIYRPGLEVQTLENPTTLSGDPVLPGFIFNVAQIWQ